MTRSISATLEAQVCRDFSALLPVLATSAGCHAGRMMGCSRAVCLYCPFYVSFRVIGRMDMGAAAASPLWSAICLPLCGCPLLCSALSPGQASSRGNSPITASPHRYLLISEPSRPEHPGTRAKNETPAPAAHCAAILARRPPLPSQHTPRACRADDRETCVSPCATKTKAQSGLAPSVRSVFARPRVVLLCLVAVDPVLEAWVWLSTAFKGSFYQIR